MPIFTPINADDYKVLLETSASPYVVKIHASFCGPCKIMAPRLDALAAQYPQVRFFALQADTSPEEMVRVRGLGFSTVPVIAVGSVKGEKPTLFMGPTADQPLKAWLESL